METPAIKPDWYLTNPSCAEKVSYVRGTSTCLVLAIFRAPIITLKLIFDLLFIETSVQSMSIL